MALTWFLSPKTETTLHQRTVFAEELDVWICVCQNRSLSFQVPVGPGALYLCAKRESSSGFLVSRTLLSSALGPVGPGSYRETENCMGKPELLASSQVCNVYKTLIVWWSTRLPQTLSISSMTLFQTKLPYACQSRFSCCFFSLNSTQKHYMTLARPAVPEKCSKNSYFLSQPSRLRMCPAANHPAALCQGSRYFTKSGQHYKGTTGNCKAERQLAAAQHSPHFLCTISVTFHSNLCAIWRNTELCHSELQADLCVPLILLNEHKNRNRQNDVIKHTVEKESEETPSSIFKSHLPQYSWDDSNIYWSTADTLD